MRSFASKQKYIYIFSCSFSPDIWAFQNIYSCKTCQSKNVLSGTIFIEKGLPCLDCVSCNAHKINNFIRVSCLKLFSSASCFSLLPSRSVREIKLSWIPEISLFIWVYELVFYTLPLCAQGKAPLLHNHLCGSFTSSKALAPVSAHITSENIPYLTAQICSEASTYIYFGLNLTL